MSEPLPHTHAPILAAGMPLAAATHALVLFHGRGADAEGMLALAEALDVPGAWAVLAPQADAHSWWPSSGFAPFFENEPWMDGALACAQRTVAEALAAGIPAERIVVGGFSQGACLALDYAVRHPQRFGALLGFAGGLLGPPGTRWDDLPAALDGTPALLAVHDNDPWIPLVRVEETARVLTEKGAVVDARLYRGTHHTIMPESVEAAQALIANVG
ncbi:MAG: dienelactone hydrolase family protein [Bacteroidetes bacterium]|nr:dienelactone hydrolase family protein [Bacteroidota bacterium]